MKIFCQTCTVHFVDEFEKTILPPCNFWGEVALSNLPVEYKKKIWDWVFSLPVDEISIKFQIGISISFHGNPVVETDKFENLIPDYTKMTDAEKKEAQRIYFKEKTKVDIIDARAINKKPKKERIVN